MGNTDATPDIDTPPGWRLMTSDTGRLWASREQAFSGPEMAAGASRTVDGDDLIELLHAIAEQEALAESVGAPPFVPEPRAES